MTFTAGVVCEEGSNGTFAIPGDICHYKECDNGRAFKRACAQGTVFNADSNNCTWPEDRDAPNPCEKGIELH